MKSVYFFLFFILSLDAYSQLSFMPNEGERIKDDVLDSTIVFRYRFLEAGAWAYSSMLEVTLSTDSSWNYKRVLIKNNDQQILELPPMDKSINIDSLWLDLSSMGFMELPSEQEMVKYVTKNGKLFKVSNQQYEAIQPTDISLYLSEFQNHHSTRVIYHNAPKYMMERLTSGSHSSETWYVPDLYKASFCYELIMKRFNFSDFKEQYLIHFVKDGSKEKETR